MSLSLASLRPATARSDAGCPMAPLLQANRDGRLGEREAASLARHLTICEPCRALERDLDEVRRLLRASSSPPLTPFEHQRGRLALLRAAAAPLPPRPSIRRARPLALLGASAGVALACLAAAPRHLRPAPIAVAQHLPADVIRPAAQSPGPGEPVAVLAAAAPEPAPSSPDPGPTTSTTLPNRDRQGAGAAGQPAASSSPRRPLPHGRGSEALPDDASRAFNDAVETLGRGDYAAARARLDAFRATHPNDARADLASFLAIVSLQHAGRHAEAQEAARRYLELYPAGDRRAEVLRVAAGR